MHKTSMAALLALAAASVVPNAAEAAKYSAPHLFCAKKNCTDGAGPWAPPVGDGTGNYYGTTSAGGAGSEGVIYRMSLSGKHWTYSVLYSFCAQKKCADGSEAHGGLVRDTAGNLYGTTVEGGTTGQGVIYELSPNGSGWKYKVLYDFCSAKDCADGSLPQEVTLAYQGQASGVPYDGSSALYGTTGSGGHGSGVAFSLTPNAGKTKWTEKVIHAFCAKSQCTDGGTPFTGVMVDGSGNLFGTSISGAKYAKGAVYELQPNGANWIYTVLHDFCADQNTCVDGAVPVGVPVMDGAGNLFGTTAAGGTGGATPGQGGTAYKLTRSGAKWKLSTLHNFCLETDCDDGQAPYSSLLIDAGGHLFGTTYLGGDANAGTMFRLSGGKLTTFDRLLSFGGTDTPGTIPIGGMMLDSSGAFFGAAATGGNANGGGAFYEYTP